MEKPQQQLLPSVFDPKDVDAVAHLLPTTRLIMASRPPLR